jgi:hypothetical protein
MDHNLHVQRADIITVTSESGEERGEKKAEEKKAPARTKDYSAFDALAKKTAAAVAAVKSGRKFGIKPKPTVKKPTPTAVKRPLKLNVSDQKKGKTKVSGSGSSSSTSGEEWDKSSVGSEAVVGDVDGINRALLKIVSPPNTTSDIWNHFGKYPANFGDVRDKDDFDKPFKHYACCNYCRAAHVSNPLNGGVGQQKWDVWMTVTNSTSKLSQHLNSHHKDMVKDQMEKEATVRLQASLKGRGKASSVASGMLNFVKPDNTFHDLFLQLVINKNLPLLLPILNSSKICSNLSLKTPQ